MSTRRTFLIQTAATTVVAAAAAQVGRAATQVAGGTSSASMKTYRIPQSDLTISRVAYGCANLVSWDRVAITSEERARAERTINTALEQGITLFDHANLYGFGKCEEAFGQILDGSPGLRKKIVVQSKCGQRFADGWQPGLPIHVDLSREHILTSVDESLKRLRTDYLDILLLHAPSTLMKPEEVAAAFEQLHRGGKVRCFGVSNFSDTQIQLLQKTVRQPIVINQIHLGLAHSDALSDGLEFTLELAKGDLNFQRYQGISGSGTVDFCRLQGIQIQAWSPLRGLSLNPSADGSPVMKATAQKLTDLAKEKSSTAAAVALAWLLHHPAGIVPIIGSTKPEHIIENCASDRVTLSNEEWYSLFATAVDLKSRAMS